MEGGGGIILKCCVFAGRFADVYSNSLEGQGTADGGNFFSSSISTLYSSIGREHYSRTLDLTVANLSYSYPIPTV
jgi:hypothetical protein